MYSLPCTLICRGSLRVSQAVCCECTCVLHDVLQAEVPVPEAQALRCGQRSQHLQGAGSATEQALLKIETRSQQTDWRQQHD